MTVSATPSLRFVDVSGVGNSGKSAIVDLLREVDGVFAPEYWFEFDILRVPGGLIDLRHALVDDWSPIRSHAAIHEFREVVRKMGRDPRWWDIAGLADATSQRYDRRFGGQFVKLSGAFADAFVIGTYRAEWPYDGLRENPVVRLARKVLGRLGFRKQLSRAVLLADGKGFDARASAYLQTLYRLFVPPATEWAVFNNGFEPFNPVPCLDMIAESRQIVVTRDPRDVYVSGLNFHNVQRADQSLLAFDNDGMNKSFLATDDLELFVRRYRLYHTHLYSGGDARVLTMRFEDIVRDHERSVQRVLNFLGIAPSRHSRSGTTFIPEKSARNVGLWKQYSRSDEIAYIAAELSPFLVD